MVKSEQRVELGEKWFEHLQDEIVAAPAEDLEVFLSVRDPDIMGPIGKEGVDDGD